MPADEFTTELSSVVRTSSFSSTLPPTLLQSSEMVNGPFVRTVLFGSATLEVTGGMTAWSIVPASMIPGTSFLICFLTIFLTLPTLSAAVPGDDPRARTIRHSAVPRTRLRRWNASPHPLRRKAPDGAGEP